MPKKNKKVVKPGKSITNSKAAELRNKWLKISEQKIQELVLDFAKVETVDVIGLGLVLATHNTMKESGGSLELINVPEEIHGLFHATGMDRHFEIQSA